MSDFKVEVTEVLEVKPIPDADRIEEVKIRGFSVVSQKGLYKPGQAVVYAPESSIIPNWLLEKYSFNLAGSNKNRVKPIKIRGVLSEGIIIPLTRIGNQWYVELEGDALPPGIPKDYVHVKKGQDVAKLYGIEKYVPEIPTHMAGNVINSTGFTHNYDVENIKKYNDVLIDGEPVTITSKLHGTQIQIGIYPSEKGSEEGCKLIVASKGISHQGLSFNIETNPDNVYVRVANKTIETINPQYWYDQFDEDKTPICIFGEVVGPKIQKGFNYGYSTPSLEVFDIYIGMPNKGSWVPRKELPSYVERMGLKTVPFIYDGPWDYSRLKEWTNQKVCEGHIDEGIVICADRPFDNYERVLLKSISESYLLRKGKTTEYN
jgi:RNA ligase (TIGR02306 family)